MFLGQKIVVAMPAYDAAKTLRRTYGEMLAQIPWRGTFIAEVSCPTKYFKEASSINFQRSVKYGLGCVATALHYRLCKLGLAQSLRYPAS